jgi:putative ABC transport system permease protein
VTIWTLVVGNVWATRARSGGIVLAAALAVMTVVTLSVVSNGLESAAAAVLTVGKADFTVAQKGVSDILYSTLDQRELAAVRSTPGVHSAVGVLVETEHLSAANPLFLEIGIAPDELTPFGVRVVAGHPYAADATDQVMLGWQAARNLGLGVGDRFRADGTVNTVVGIYDTGVSFGDLGAMFPLPAVQSYNRVPGAVTLVFVKVDPGAAPSRVAAAIDRNLPELATIRTADQFGRADRNLVFLQAAVTGSTVLALLIGAVIVGNTMLLSLFERTREFGLLRAIGWSRARVVGLVLAEGLSLSLVGFVVGVGLSVVVAGLLEDLPQLRGILHASFSLGAYGRGLVVGLGMAVLGSLYPSLRAASLAPGRALSRE